MSTVGLAILGVCAALVAWLAYEIVTAPVIEDEPEDSDLYLAEMCRRALRPEPFEITSPHDRRNNP
jgi:hypothetical protein